jgi:glycosyltransferase involved in cell wall biosynthesis
VGDGPEHRRLRATAGDRVRLLGRVDDERLAEVYAGARALIVPNVEEFGIAAVEAQASGRPVLALGEGGSRETVVDGVTGTLVEDGSPERFAEAMREVDFSRFDPSAARANAERFSATRFRERLRAAVGAAQGGG